MADHNLPTIAAIKVESHPKLCFIYEKDDRAVCGEETVFSAFVKVEVVKSTKYPDNYVHLRFYQTNKYWIRNGENQIVATSTEAEEDITKESCTLFEPFSSGENIHLKHVKSGLNVFANVPTGQAATRVFLSHSGQGTLLSFVDLDALAKMPEHAAFRGDNGKFLKVVDIDGSPYLQFSSELSDDMATHFHVYNLPDGHVRIKSVLFDKFWRRSLNWILADSDDESTINKDTLFLPKKIDDITFAITNEGDYHVCKRFTGEGKTDCLNAPSPIIDDRGRLKVQDIVH